MSNRVWVLDKINKVVEVYQTQNGQLQSNQIEEFSVLTLEHSVASKQTMLAQNTSGIAEMAQGTNPNYLLTNSLKDNLDLEIMSLKLPEKPFKNFQ